MSVYLNQKSVHFSEYQAIIKAYKNEVSKIDYSGMQVQDLFDHVNKINVARDKASWAVAKLAFNHFHDLIDRTNSNPYVIQSFSGVIVEMTQAAKIEHKQIFEEKAIKFKSLVDQHLLKDI